MVANPSNELMYKLKNEIITGNVLLIILYLMF